MWEGFDQPLFGKSRVAKDVEKIRGNGGTATSFISEGGGLAGSLAGAGIGTMILPGVGTVIGAGLGGLIGGFGGSAAEQKVRNNEVNWGQAGREGAIEGIMSAGPLKLGKLGYGAVRGGTTASEQLGKSILKRGASELASETGEEVLKTSAGSKLRRLSNNELARQYGTISKPVARQTGSTNTVGALADMGIIKPTDAERVAHGITGSDGILNKAVIKATGEAGGVNTSTLRQVFSDALDNRGIVGNQRKSLELMFEGQMKAVSGGAKGSLDPLANPSDVLSMMKNLEKQSANLKGKGGNYKMITPEHENQAAVLDLVKDELQDQLYEGAGANKNLARILTPQLREELVALHPGNKQWAKYVDNNIMTAQDVGTLRGAQKPFVNIRQIIDEGEINAMTFGGRATPTNGGGIKSQAVQAAAEAVRAPIARGGARMLRAGDGIAGAIAPVRNAARSLYPIPGSLAGSLMNTSATSNQERAQNPTDMTAGMNNSAPSDLTDSLSDQSGGAAASSPYSREQLVADMQRDPKNAKDYLEYFQMMQEAYAPSSGTEDMSQSSRNAMASSDNAINTIDQLEGLFTQAGSGSGRIGGSLKGWAAKAGLDESAQVYNNLSQASVTQIAKALAGSGAGTVSDMDAKVIIAALPTIRDTPEEARIKFAALKQRLATARNNTMRYGSGGGSLEEALASQGAH
jgi:hypothetical protein